MSRAAPGALHEAERLHRRRFRSVRDDLGPLEVTYDYAAIREVNDRAAEILAELEATHHEGTLVVNRDPKSVQGSARPRRRVDNNHRGAARTHFQLSLFEAADHPLLDAIRGVDLDELGEAEALELVKTWQRQLGDEAARARPR